MSGPQSQHNTTHSALHLAASPGKDGVEFGLCGDLLDHAPDVCSSGRSSFTYKNLAAEKVRKS
jgi:hypothetical protein